MVQPFKSLMDAGTKLDRALLVLKAAALYLRPEGRREN